MSLTSPRGGRMLLLASCFLVTLGTSAGVFDETLKYREKQLLLDLHNSYRASVQATNMRRLSWDRQLENDAQEEANSCFFQITAATNVYYNTSEIQGDSSDAIGAIVPGWLPSAAEQPLRWYRTTRMGCAVNKCGRLTRDMDLPLTNSFFVVCKYSPRYFKSASGQLYQEGRCRNSTCPTDADKCVAYNGGAVLNQKLYSYCGTDDSNPSAPMDAVRPDVTRRVYYITPGTGSVGGGTEVTIYGLGFSVNQFEGGNMVTMVPRTGTGNITCDVVRYSSSATKIECVTRAAPVGTTDAYYYFHISSNDGSGSGFVQLGTCSRCLFRYNLGYWTPIIMNMSSYASHGNFPLTLGGSLFSAEFDDPDDPEDLSDSNTDRDDNRRDFYSRILVGGRGCNHMRENGSWYSATLDDRGITATVECKPDLGEMIASHNVTVVLGRRGNSVIRRSDNIMSLDNNLQIYHFQTYADILGVSPSSGSVEGGTRITITMDHSLVGYADDVTVKVGGAPCDNITVMPNNTDMEQGQIVCITRPRPLNYTYYPGGRGVLREAFEGFQNLGPFRRENPPRSSDIIILDRFFTGHLDEGTRKLFRKRYSGFFVPPKTSLYTFNVRSDDHSRLYFSSNMSTEGLQEVITINTWTRKSWSYRGYQLSEPIYLKKDEAYYFEVHLNQGGGHWEIGLAAKLHDSTLHGGDYDADRESQRIQVTSEIIKEEHLIEVEGTPHVQLVSFQPSSSAQLNDSVMIGCPVTLRIRKGSQTVQIAVSAFAAGSMLEQQLNNINLISMIGRVSVIKSGYSGSTNDFWSSTSSVINFEIIFATNHGVSDRDIPVISLDSPITCSSHTSLVLNCTSEITQHTNIPLSFRVGFNRTLSGQPHYTSSIPVNSNETSVTEKLNELLTWECDEDDDISAKSDIYETYETSMTSRSHPNAFCGFQSKADPGTVRDTTYTLSTRPYICFAYKGNFPGLVVSFSYRKRTTKNGDTTSSTGSTSITIDSGCSSWPFDAQLNRDGWTNYGCIDVRTCVNQDLPSSDTVQYDRHKITNVRFISRRNFFIDNLAFARSTVQIERTSRAPIAPNNVVINHIVVTGGLLSTPNITRSSSGAASKYTMTVAKFNIQYNVVECGHGMELIQSHSSNSYGIKLSRVQAGSGPVDGLFDITIGNNTLKDVNATISRAAMETLFDIEFKDYGAFQVSRAGSCRGYRWDIDWENTYGDQPPINLSNKRLTGASANVSVVTLVDGGVWIRPIRGDMLRLPETNPQVEVVINRIPSSCTSKNCSFMYEDDSTPQIFDISPSQGVSGTTVSINGSDFSTEVDDITVTIGKSPCDVTFVNESLIQCTVGSQSAGCYRVSVDIEGMGVASAGDEVCFKYLVMINSVSPAMGGVSGGNIIKISGEGFPRFEKYRSEKLGPLSYLPWFRYGIGSPALDIAGANYCPSFRSMLESLWDMKGPMNMSTPSLVATVNSLKELVSQMYSTSPLKVQIGDTPCIIVESTISTITCIPLPASAGLLNVTVTVFNQSHVVEEAYTVSDSGSMTIQGISPSTGAVVGNSTVLIIGSQFDSGNGSDIKVMIGGRPCLVQTVNSTQIQCSLPRMEPGQFPVVVYSTAGVAVLPESLSQIPIVNISSLFPLFTYKLEITNASLSRGSSFGGTEVTLYGGTFVAGQTSVLVGNVAANVVSVSDSELKFATPTSSKTHSAGLSARLLNTESTTVTYLFNWNVSNFTITVGDSIEWNWAIPLNVDQMLIFEIFETTGQGSSIRKSGGFHSSSRSQIFSQTFNEVGTYYYASTNNLNTDLTFGEVIVTYIANSRSSVEVFVGGFAASYSMAPPDSNSPSRERRQAAECAETLPPTDAIGLFFHYSPCLTPVVHRVMPNTANLINTVFTIQGSRFSASANIIHFGEYSCIPLTQTPTEITCKLDVSAQPPPYTSLLVLVRNTDPGYGNAFVLNETASTVIILPLITTVSPAQGSLAGGTDVLISGSTLIITQVGMEIHLGDGRCVVKYVDYNSIGCTTRASNEMEGSTIQFYQGSNELNYLCNDTGNCSFSFLEEATPQVVDILPTVVRSPGTQTIAFVGRRFSTVHHQYSLTVGTVLCPIVSSNSTVIYCELPPLPSGLYSVQLSICNLTSNGSRCFGSGQFADGARRVRVEAGITGISPTSGSVFGETEVTLYGYGFSGSPDSISVMMDNSECDVTSATNKEIKCLTPRHSAGVVVVEVTDRMSPVMSINTLNFEFTANNTPTVASVSPSTGAPGEVIVVTGDMFDASNGTVSVMVGGTPCESHQVVNNSFINCMLGPNFAGNHPVTVTVPGIGSSDSNLQVTYTLVVNSISNTSGSFAGGNRLEIQGSGFDPSDTTITICEEVCQRTSTIPTATTIDCIVPAASAPVATQQLSCNVTVQSLGQTVVHSQQYTYLQSLTATVTFINDTRGGTEGGTPLLIRGSGFSAEVTVTIANSPCVVASRLETEITCVTNRTGRTVRAPVKVWVDGKGFAMSSKEFWYVDLWSSRFTWGGGPLPREGDFVVIPKGQTLVLDTKTPVLSYLLIQGGELIFDREKGDNEVELHTMGGLITSGGRLEVGTEDKPFLSRTQIVLYGHVLSTEIPVYGAKTLALRKGEIHMHGRPINVTWTRLRVTAKAGDSQIHLQDNVDWDIGGKIVLASTSFSQRENEEKEIQSISYGPSGSTITLTSPLEYEHISVEQTIAGRTIETRGEVGYLTRNIVVRGNRNAEWDMVVPDCPEEFRPGQFETQTCFQGRFGSEVVGDQFGSQIMIHAAEQNQGHVLAQFEYIEVTHAGQAFRLGRYPIHYHLNGNVSGSYVRGCGIHHTFNRAVTIHAVDYLLVEKNVAFNILGHAYFLEDGIEEYNIIQDNLGVFVRGSSSLLNVDITPATFWIVNPNNIVRRNAAAGGTHFGYWYRLPEFPTGPSFTRSVCPQKIPVLKFEDNTAHSFGWYGLWVFMFYYPSLSGGCNDNTPGTAHFDRFFAWRNDRGVEFTDIGAMQLRDSVLMENRLSGVEYTEVESIWDEVNGSLVTNTLIIGYGNSSASDFCTESGLVTPKSYYLTVSGVTFANFDRNSCVPVSACSHCKFMQGGFETRYRNITYVNAGTKITKWQWPHEQIHRDLDGTLTRTGEPKLLIPTNELLDSSKCQNHPGSAQAEGTQGSICDGDISFGRLAIFSPTPASLQFVSLNVSNNHGKTVLPYVPKRLRGTGPGQMMQVQFNTAYQLAFQDGETFTNVSYNTLISGFSENDYVVIKHVYPQPLDRINIAGVTTASNVSVLSDPANAQTGDFSIGSDNVTLNYVLRGGNFPLNEGRNSFQTERCRYPMCILPLPPTQPPPISPGRPSNALMWSNTSIWPGNRLPQEGETVNISRGLYVIMDVPIPRLSMLFIQGGLEILDNQDRTIEANTIVIDGGRLVAGYPDTPFRNQLRIILHGNERSPTYRHGPERIVVGTKAIGVFGELILHSDIENPITWTLLGSTASRSSNQITLTEAVNWEVGDEIFITSTSFDAYQTETLKITSVSNNKQTLTLNATLSNTHLGVQESVGSVSYSIRAEVGRLTKKISIENGDPDTADSESFGCRVLVSSGDFSGKVQLNGVEFKGCGQIGRSEEYDPRFALAFVNTGRQTDAYVRHCSFHSGYNTAIGMFSTSNMEITSNVIHGTVGPSMIITGSSHTIVNNLASLSHFIGTYKDRNEPKNGLWTANFEITGALGINFTYNHAAGGNKAGIHTDGEDCIESSSVIRHNVAHSTLHGFHMGYSGGSPTLCSRFDNITAYACNHYGFFTFSPAGIQIYDSTFINNKVAIFATATGPSILSHILSTKTVEIERSKIISASRTFNCNDDELIPDIARHPNSFSPGILSPTGGHIGIVQPTFLTGRGKFPKFPWPQIFGYPAIAGLSTVNQVSFTNFGLRCSNKKDVVIMTNPFSEDANHPVHLSQITFESDGRFTSNSEGITNRCRVFVQEPDLSSINPSDCVDMDCDGRKHVIFTDLDGSFTGTGSFRTIISKAEFEWDGDRRRGLNDGRIPKTMLSEPDGSRIAVSDIYPQKGVVRSNTFGGSGECIFNMDWNMYLCEDLEHLMLVLESLDDDTEVRRLSPIGIGANGFINLLNGPQDHGWCGGYTCQERVSTFFGIVASSFNYTIGLTSTNPQNFALHLLNSNDMQGIVVRIIYTNPQRLDVYVRSGSEDVYVPPKNAKLLDNGNLNYSSSPNTLQFYPTLNDVHGANYYDRSLKQLHVNIKGSSTYKIITTPVIMLSVTLSVTTDDFFAEEFLVRNLALLLDIPSDRIRVVNVVRETSGGGKRRKRQASATETIEIEIGDPPMQVIMTEVENTTMTTDNTTSNASNAYNNTTPTTPVQPTTTPTTNSLSYSQLTELTETVAAAVQTGEILQGTSGVAVVEAAVEEPAPPPVDPTGGMRATPETGGPQPADIGENSTVLTFSERQMINESIESNQTAPAIRLSIPSRLQNTKLFGSKIVEGIPVPSNSAPVFTMLDNNGMVTETLGVGTPWKLTAVMTDGPRGAFLSNHVTDFINGRASFEGVTFSHPGTYNLMFIVTLPQTAKFSVDYGSVTVQKQPLALSIIQQPQEGNTTFNLYPYPAVRLNDGQGNHLQDHSWRNSTWYVTATLQSGNQKWSTQLMKGMATFKNIRVWTPGQHRLIFQATTDPEPGSNDLLPAVVTSNSFRIHKRTITRFSITYDVSFDAIRNSTAEFVEQFETRFKSQYPDAELFNTTVREGSIVVSTFVTAKTTSQLVDIINRINTEGNQSLAFSYRNLALVPSSVVQDPDYTVQANSNLVLILAVTIAGGVAILVICAVVIVCVAVFCCRRKKNSDKYGPKASYMANMYEATPRSGIGLTEYDDVDEFYLKDDSTLEKDHIPLNAPTIPEKEVEVVTSKVDVPGSFYANSSGSGSIKDDLGASNGISEEKF